MAAEPARLLALAEAISDGRDVDWAAAESGAENAEEAALVRELKLLAGVATVSRSGSTDALVDPDLIPGSWGTLEIRSVVGAGTFGTVYRAWDARLDREVALKLLKRRPGDAAPSTVVSEGRRLAQVRHPHVVVVYGADCIEGQVGIWMDYIQGRTLEDLLAERGPLGAAEAALIGVDVCSALAAVHQAGIIHRDIKAQNIMREDGGRIVLMDFGAGEDTADEGPSAAVGTPIYMAPELFRGGRASAQSDIYSVGVLLFRQVTGSYPVNGRTAAEIDENQRLGVTRRLRDLRPDLPSAFVSLVEQALARHPAERFASAGDMEAALQRVLAPEPPAAATVPRGIARRRFGRHAFASLMVFAVLGLAATVPFVRQRVVGVFAQREVSVTILPFANASGDAAQEHISRGVRDVLISRLATITALHVIAPAGPVLPATAGSSLAAGYAIEGSAQRTGERLHVTVRLLKAAAGEVVWTDSYDRPLQDLFAVQNEIALAVARRVGVRLSDAERQRLAMQYSISAEAQDAYLQGRFLLYRFNRAASAQARGYFERAIAIDPSYALAHASLARLYLLQQEYRDLTPAEARPLASYAATRAAELGPDLAEAHVALAETLFKVAHDAAGADAHYRAALELSPGSSLVRSPYARFLSALGRTDEALVQALEGARSDPFSPEMMSSVGITYVYQHDFPRAMEWYDRAIAANDQYAPGYFGRGRARSFLGQFRESVEDLNRAVVLSGEDPSYLAELARVNAAAGWRNAAEEILGSLLHISAQRPGAVAPQDLAYVYLALGDRDRACALLQQALTEQDTRILFLRVDPRVDALRGDPRLDDFIRALGL